MALEKLAQVGHMVHVYDFRVSPGTGEAFIRAFDEYDVSADNPMHKSAAQVKDGVLCRDYDDPDHFYLIGEWTSVEEHRAILRDLVAKGKPPAFLKYIANNEFSPRYTEVVAPTY
ncbi:MAG: hypothetical protein FJX56_05015 [Alphaproteobacteria bacterium]|nr:hypothetical protein [Alphaproteobacteria bacterium]